MKASDKAIQCIKKWEGCHERLGNGLLRAYLCPAKRWTIGWGSITLDGRAVKEGDLINQQTADALLLKEADQCAAAMAARYPECNENQLAALTSLTFNIGTGGIGEGLDSLLKSKAWQGAADKFLEYNKADGAPLEGLTNRRKDERALFLEPVAGDVVSGEREVGWFEARLRLNDGDWTVGVIAKVAGSDENFATAEIPVQMDLVQKFTGAWGNHSVVLAAPDKPWPGVVVPEKPVEPVGEVYLKLQRTGDKEAKGCEVLLLTMEGSNESWYVRSGQPHAQEFQKAGPENHPGSMMPLPQGTYGVENIEFAQGKKDDYTVSHGTGLGPVWIGLPCKFATARGAFGLHLDTGAYGTAGCVGLRSVEDLKSLVAALRKHDPKRLVVAWGL